MKKIVEKKTSEIAAINHETTALITAIERVALDPSMEINKLERMLDMQVKVMDRQAKMEYNQAMASLQSKLPIVNKTGVINDKHGNLRSKYAKFEDIVEAIQPLLDQHGFSITFKANFDNGLLMITGQVSHAAGHQETAEMILPFDDSGAKNKVQAIGSSVSYGKRYTLTMLINIATRGEDDDGHSAHEDKYNSALFELQQFRNMGFATNPNISSIAAIREAVDQEDYHSAAEFYFEIEEKQREHLWMATKKGGSAWRPQDREAIKLEINKLDPRRLKRLDPKPQEAPPK